MEKALVLYHGSSTVIEKPVFGYGNQHNDYGLGFYCTQQKDLACEWACPTNNNGICNCYKLDMAGLCILDLRKPEFSLLNWLALLVAHRSFESTSSLMKQAKTWLLSNHLPDVAGVDVIIGMRADDSYYSFARSFLDGRLSLQELERAMELGWLGHQVVLVSRQAFEALRFEGSEQVLASEWHRRRQQRDQSAREAYRTMVEAAEFDRDALYVAQIMREGR